MEQNGKMDMQDREVIVKGLLMNELDEMIDEESSCSAVRRLNWKLNGIDVLVLKHMDASAWKEIEEDICSLLVDVTKGFFIQGFCVEWQLVRLGQRKRKKNYKWKEDIVVKQPEKGTRDVNDTFYEAEARRINRLNEDFFKNVDLIQAENDVLVWLCRWDEWTIDAIISVFAKISCRQ